MRITLRGTDELGAPPERGTARLLLQYEGTDRSRVLADTRRLALTVQADVDSLRGPDGPVTDVHTDSLAVRSWVPVDRDGRPQERVHVATIPVRVEFSDFDELSTRTFTWSGLEGVVVEGVDWDLTDATRRDLEERTLTGALADARRRARILAAAAGAGDVRVVEVADRGMLGGGGDDGSFTPVGIAGARMLAAPGGDEGLRIEPRDVVVRAEVDVVLEA